jgi:hypothetical protein
MVNIDFSQFDDKTEMVNITLPCRVLRRMNAYTKRMSETRSGFRAALQAIYEYIEQATQLGKNEL